MKEYSHSSDSDTRGTSRRSFLKYSTAAAASLAVGATAAASGPQASEAHVVTGTFDDPVGTDRLEAVRQKALVDFNKRGGDLDAVPVKADPEVSGDGRLVSYAYQIDANGVPRAYAGFAGDRQSVGELKRKAETKAQEFSTTSTQSVTAQSPNWQLWLQNQADFCKDPYGCVTNNFEIDALYDDGDAVDDAYGVRHFFVMEPGKQKYGSGWHNWRGRPRHDWAAGEHGEDLAKYDPLGTNNGSTTIDVSIGTGGASLGWSYTQPAVETIDNSSPSGNYAAWTEKFNTSQARDNTNGMQPGSSCWVVDQPSGSGEVKLMTLRSEGEFRETDFWSGDDFYTLWHNWNISVIY